MLLLLALAVVALQLGLGAAHSNLIYPKPRNAIDSLLPEWSGGKAPYVWKGGPEPFHVPCVCKNGTQPCESAQTCLWMSVGCRLVQICLFLHIIYQPYDTITEFGNLCIKLEIMSLSSQYRLQGVRRWHARRHKPKLQGPLQEWCEGDHQQRTPPHNQPRGQSGLRRRLVPVEPVESTRNGTCV